MPVENDVALQNGQDTGGGGGGGTAVVSSSDNIAEQQQQVPEERLPQEPVPNTNLVNGTHKTVVPPTTTTTTSDDQTAQESPKDVKKSDGSASFLRAARAGNLEKVLEFLKTNTDINTCNTNGLNALHLASKEGHVHVVTELLQRGASVDAATKKGNTALHIASLAGQEEIVKVLVQHQALVNIQSQNGFTPLYMAAQENHDNVVRFLLANNANQSLATEDGFTPLAVALQQGHDKVVAVLLENDTRGKVRLPALHIAAKKDDTKAAALLLHTDHNPDVTSKSGFTPLHIAAHYGNENIANLLIQRGADVNYIAKHQITPLHVASKWGKGNMVSLLIDKGANYEAKTRDGLTPLHCAARSGHESVVDMLLEKGAPITSKTKNGLAPLHMASQGDHVDAARILLYHKAPVDDVTVDFLTALHVAAHCGHVRVAKLLLDRKADPNSRALNGFTPLHIACKKNRIKVVELLLKHGASIEATTESGLTPLHVASFMGCMNIVIYLIQHLASADVPTVRGETPLHLAARANQTDIIRILLRNGAQVDARAREQQTALHIASRLGNSDIVVLLLQHGAAVDATTKDHYTALHIAAKEGQEEVASVLLEHGASLTSTTKKGFTPLHLAAKYGNMKVARLLLQKDAPVDAQGKNGVTPLHVAAHYDHQNVALLLLDKGASPHATAKNGYTPLHIAARKNQMDIATTLLEYGASSNAESKAGFTPLHLSSQEGHTDMATLLIEHNAASGVCAKNGLTPLHLCSQEDRVNVAAILVKHGAQIDPLTKAGYSPLHVASHFGQMNMVRFLLQHGSKVDSTTQLGYTPLHQAAQQGHTQIVNLLLENKAEPNAETNDGKTALSIAQRLGYISVVETLKIVTETTITTTTTTTTEEKYKVVVPETMHETFMSESEDEGGDDNLVSSMFGKPQHVTLPYYEGQLRYTSDDTMLGDQSYRYLTVDEMKSLGDDSLPIDVTKDEKMDVSFIGNSMAAPPVAPADQLSPQHQKEQHYAQFTGSYPSDNVDIAKTPILAGVSLNSLASCLSVGTNTSGMWRDRFLVSFMVDARGGAMRGCRHSGVRVIIPPRKAAMPMRITCRYLKKDKLVHAPPLMEGEALASRILEMGPAGAKFLGPVIIEVPHFASLRGKEREIVILRSDNGETWREHTLEATEEAVQEVLNESFDGEELKQLEDLNTNRITRILTTDFPQYFAIVTRIRQEVHAIGPEGGMVSSTVVPQVQAVFPQGALTKKIKVGLQAQPIPTDLVAKLLGNRVAVSPIVTVEPRRRKFHKPITLTIPVPQASSKGMINQYSGEAPTLRLLCSITGGTTRAQWEDVTGSTPLTFVNDCVSFTTTVSARFWLMDCSNIPEATKMATELYREAIHVPFMAKFVVFSKRHQLEEARVRVFCMTDDREDKTLENQEMFVEVAKSRDVEVLEGKPQFLEFAGNLVPVTKSGDQLAFNFYAFRENRLPFTVRVKDQHADCIGRVAFMRQPKVGRGDPPQTPICNLNIALPDNIQPEPAPSEPDLLALEKKYSFLSISKADTIHKADLRLTDISNMLGTDWVGLARELEISDSDINIIKSQYPDNAPQQAIVMLRLWMQTSGNKANGNTLEKGLRKISRDDIVNQCIFNVELVTDDIERAMAKAHLDQSGFEAFRDELGPSRDATLNRDISLDVSYDEQDMMKEAESAEEEEENQRTYHDKTSRDQRAADMSPTYESEEKKYAGEEKIVMEEKVSKVKKDPTIIATSTVAEELEFEMKKEPVITDVKDTVDKKSSSPLIPQEEKMVKEDKPIVDIEKHAEVVDKVKESEIKKEEKAPENKETTTSTKVNEGPDGTTTTTTTTTERRSFTTDDDGAVQEHIVIEKRTTAVVDGMSSEEDKTEILQRLGEELGKLDEKLEEKFKEKRKTEEPEVTQEEVRETSVVATRHEGQAQPTSQVVVEHGPTTISTTTTTITSDISPTPEGFTQTSVETSQMSSTRGTADVSTAGTTVTMLQQDGDLITQAGKALNQQMSPQRAVDRRIAPHPDVVRHSEGDQHQDAVMQDESKIGHTEERGCSPITVIEGRTAEGNSEGKGLPLTRKGAQTITTTTSWGAPVSATTSIQLDDSKTDNGVQLTLHSQSHVTLHTSGEMWQDLQMIQQDADVKDVKGDSQSSKERHLSLAMVRKEGKSDFIPTTEEVVAMRDQQNRNIQRQRDDLNNDKPTPSTDTDLPSTHPRRSSRTKSITRTSKVYESPELEDIELPSAISNRELTTEKEVVSTDEATRLISDVDNVNPHESVDDYSLSADQGNIELTQSSVMEEAKSICDNSVVLSNDNVFTASETLAPSAHRPTTLMITSNSNESTDDAECITNDPTKSSGNNDQYQDLREETGTEGIEGTTMLPLGTAAGNTQPSSESGAIPRPERPSRPAPRTTTLVKVKVEKRPIGSHPQVRERSTHEHQSVVRVPSVEEEVRGLMQEVKEATSQIKQEVKELRQADTPTPDTPTPLREFREFINREEEQDQERLPTIKEMCRESEEDTSTNTGGEGLRGNERLHLDLDSPLLERTTPVQFVTRCFDESVHPDSGYSTLEGYYAVGSDPSVTSRYIPCYNEPVPEGSSSEPSIKSELESPSSFVDSDLSPVDSVGSATSPGSEKQGKSKFKSFMKKVRMLTSKGQLRSEINRRADRQGEDQSPVEDAYRKLSNDSCVEEGNWEESDQQKSYVKANPPVDFDSKENMNIHHDFKIPAIGLVGNVRLSIDRGDTTGDQNLIPVIRKSERYEGRYGSERNCGDNPKEVTESPGSEIFIRSPLAESPFSELSATGSQYTDSLITEPYMSDYSPESVYAFEMDNEHRKLDIENKDFYFKSGRSLPSESSSENSVTPDDSKVSSRSYASIDISVPKEHSPESARPLKVYDSICRESDDTFDLSPKETGKLLEPLIEEDETEDWDDSNFKTRSNVSSSLSRNNEKDLDSYDILKGDAGEAIQLLSEADIKAINESKYVIDAIQEENYVFSGSRIGVEYNPEEFEYSDNNMQNIEGETESLSQVTVSDCFEQMQETKELTSILPKSFTLTSSVHLAEYPQKVHIHPEFKGTPFPRTTQKHDNPHTFDREIPSEEPSTKANSVNVSKVTSHVDERKIKEELDSVLEIPNQPDPHWKRIHSTFHLDLGKNSPSAVTSHERPIYHRYDVLTSVHDQIVPEIKMDKSEEMNISALQPDKGLSSVHDYDGPEDFKTVSIKKNSNLPTTAVKAVQSQELHVKLDHSEEMHLQEYKLEKSLPSVYKGLDYEDSLDTDVTASMVYHPQDIEKAVQSQFEKEKIESGVVPLPEVDVEEAFAVSHDDSFGIAIPCIPSLHHEHEVTPCVQDQKLKEGFQQCKDLILPFIDAEEGVEMIHCDSKSTSICKAHDVYQNLKAVQVQKENEVEHRTEEITPANVPDEYGSITIHQDQGIKDFETVSIRDEMHCQHFGTMHATQQQEIDEKIDITDQLHLPRTPVESLILTDHREITSHDLGYVSVQQRKIVHPMENESVVQLQEITEDTKTTEDLPLSNNQLETVIPTDHHENRNMNYAVIKQEGIFHAYETVRKAQPQVVFQESKNTEILSLPDMPLEQSLASDHQEERDICADVYVCDKVMQPFETVRKVQPEIISDSIETTGDLTLHVLQKENITPSNHKEDISIAVIQSGKIVPPYETMRKTVSQTLVEETRAVDNLYLPDIQSVCVTPTHHKEESEIGEAVIDQIKMMHPFETVRRTVPQENFEDPEICSDLFIPNAKHENIMQTHHQEVSDFGIGISKEDVSIHPHEIVRRIIPQFFVDETQESDDLSVPKIQHENITPADHQSASDLGIAVVKEEQTMYPYEIIRKTFPQLAMEETLRSYDLVMPQAHHENVMLTDHQESADIGVASISEDKSKQPFETERKTQPQVVIEEIKSTVNLLSFDAQYENAIPSLHQSMASIGVSTLKEDEVTYPLNIVHGLQPLLSVEAKMMYHEEDEPQKDDTKMIEEMADVTSSDNSRSEVYKADYERTSPSMVNETIVENISDNSLVNVLHPKAVKEGMVETESTVKHHEKLEFDFYESEQELAKIIHKQMEELGKDQEAITIVDDHSSNFKEIDRIEASTLEVCKESIKESKSQETAGSDNTEKINMLDKVSDELRNMISSLEYSLAAGISKDIKITPILARLEHLEQEVVNITKYSGTIESSIPTIIDVNETDSVVSSPQSSPFSVKEAEATCGGIKIAKQNTDFTKMPVVLGNEPAKLHPHGGPSPTGETNGVDHLSDALTDVEDLLSDGDQSPMVKRKAALTLPEKDHGALTDTEDMDLSGEEDDYIKEKNDLPTIQDLGLLPDPTREVINLTEGFARQPSPLLSGSESDAEDVGGRHHRNLKKMESIDQDLPRDQLLAPESEPEGLTDVEDMVASGEELEEAAEAVEDSLPDHYLDQGEGVSNKEKVTAIVPPPKIFLTRQADESSDEEECSKKKPKRKSKGGLRVEAKEDGTTDVEDLAFSDCGPDNTNVEKCPPPKVELLEKPKRKKQVRRKVVKKTVGSKTLMAPTDDADALTDVEVLTGDDNEDESDDDDQLLGVGEYGDDGLTDGEDMEASDTEDVETLVAKPVQKMKPASLPAPHAEKVRISETEEKGQEDSGADTDEEGFVLDDKDDAKPLLPRNKISYEPLDLVERDALEVEDQCEAALTDTEDFDMDDKEENEILKDVQSRIPEEGEIYTLKELEGNLGSISKTESVRDVEAEYKQLIKEAESAGLTLQQVLNEETLTDVEDLDEDKTVKKKSKKKQRREDETDEESVTESDIEEEIPKPPKSKKKGRRLPLAPQISEVRFIETEQGPLSIIVTPDSYENQGKIIKDQVANVVFLEKDEPEANTDVEELSDGEGGGSKALKTPASTQDPTTDTEDLDIDPSELDRPTSPLPPNVQQSVFSSPKREIIHIKEDKYGVPQVTIRKMGNNELFVSDVEEAGVTDTEDIEVSEGEALRIVGVTEDSTSDFELPDSVKSEVSSRMTTHDGLKILSEEEDGHTDIEEITLGKKPRRKQKSQSRLIPKNQEDSHTDVELLSDQDDKIGLKVRVESPDGHTDFEDFEASEGEDFAAPIPKRENVSTPDIVNTAIKKVITFKEGPEGTIKTEESEVAPVRSSLHPNEDEAGGVTDIEDMEASGAEEDEAEKEYPPVDLGNLDSSSIDISEKSSLPKSRNESKHIKDNLLLPEDNYNNVTDVESLSEGEGNRCASNTGLLSSQQLTYAVDSCSVGELSYYLPPSTDPKLCVQPGISLESDPFCAELTSPLVVEAELEQVYYHAPEEDPREGEVELEASNGCVIRKRQVVASLCQTREVRRFWSPERNSPLNQSELSPFATPSVHKKGFKTILYLEQPDLLDTISISDTLCDSNYFRNERLLDFDSSSVDSDHFSYRDSDIVTVVDQFNQDRSSSSFDELPSPHLSSISSTGVVDSFCSGRSFGSDPPCYASPQSPMLSSFYSKCSSEDLKKESEMSLSLSGISVPSCSPDNSLNQEVELSMLDVSTNGKSYGKSPCEPIQYESTCSVNKIYEDLEAKSEKSDSIDNVSPALAHPVSNLMKGLAIECHQGFTTECTLEYASERDDVLALESTERVELEKGVDFLSGCVEGFATECIEMPAIECTKDFVNDYEEIDASSCVRISPTGYIQRSITEWIVGKNSRDFEDNKNQINLHTDVSESHDALPTVQSLGNPEITSLNQSISESVSQPTSLKHNISTGESRHKDIPVTSVLKLVPSFPENKNEFTQPLISKNVNQQSSRILQSDGCSIIPWEDSGVHEYQTSGSFTSSFDRWDKIAKNSHDSDCISLADSVLGMEDQRDRDLLEESSITYISAQYSPSSHEEFSSKSHNDCSVLYKAPHYSQSTCEEFSPLDKVKKTTETATKDNEMCPAGSGPLTGHHTLPRTRRQLKSQGNLLAHKVSGSVSRDCTDITSKDFGSVKGLIDQWEVIVREEHLKSLPSSPAIGRKILPPPPSGDIFGLKKFSLGSSDGELKSGGVASNSKVSSQTSQKSEELDSFDGGGSVIEEVASVCDIIQQFEGRVGRLGKMNAHRQRLPRGSQSPVSRSPSHQRRVATVKPLCEPQRQQDNNWLLQGGQVALQEQQHRQEQMRESLEHSDAVSDGFVPRVVESLSITKGSNDIRDENPPHASVSNPEGTHEATQNAEQQQSSISHDQGVDVEEMSNIMESYTSDGSDHLITTTTTTTTSHTNTSNDPDPITSTQVTRITRTEIEDGEVKEDVYEEY